MPSSLKLAIAGVVAVSAIALLAATSLYPPSDEVALRVVTAPRTNPATWEVPLGILFWTGMTLMASVLPIQMPRGTVNSVAIAPIVAATVLGGPGVGGLVAALGTTELRELRGHVPWYGTAANHAGVALPAIVGGLVGRLFGSGSANLVEQLVGAIVTSVVFYVGNMGIAALFIALRTGQPLATVVIGDARATSISNIALAPLAWLMTLAYSAAWWATLLFALPLYTTRLGYQRFMEMRLMFTQTIGALAAAVDARDPFTAKHSHNVKSISVEIGRAMRLGDADLEALEWGGLLHDVGKIGVRDDVLLKTERLNREERMKMNSHPVIGAEIIAPVQKLAPELPIIRHHHEWYNGSGYPDRLMGDEIPLLARILHVADAFEAMTAARPYRMTPLTAEQALGELRKFAGIQFDPVVVDAFVRTHYADGVPDPGRQAEPKPIPLIGQAANGMSAARAEAPAVHPARAEVTSIPAPRADTSAPTAKQA